MRSKASLALALVLALLACVMVGCVRVEPIIVPGVTIPPTPSPTPTPTPLPTPSPTPTQTPAEAPQPAYDALGALITATDHYKRYLSFTNIEVYEQAEDTFVDAVMLNAYPEPLICAVSITFFDGEGLPVANGRFQTGDGQYVLILPGGQTRVFAQIDTDMRLTDREFDLAFDGALGVHPDAAGR